MKTNTPDQSGFSGVTVVKECEACRDVATQLYLIAEQNALHRAVNSLRVVLGTHFKQVLLWRQQLLRGLL